MAKLKYNIIKRVFTNWQKANPSFGLLIVMCVSFTSLSVGKRKFLLMWTDKLKAGQECARPKEKKRCEVRFVWSGSLTSTKSKIIGGAARKDGEEKVGNELCLVQPLLLSLPLIEKYISTQLRNKFVSNWEIYIHPNEKHISAQLGNIFLHKVYYCFFSRCR